MLTITCTSCSKSIVIDPDNARPAMQEAITHQEEHEVLPKVAASRVAWTVSA